MSQLPRYESYKDSGVQWLGEIPSHWDVKRMKFVVANVGDKVDAKESDLRYFGLENIESFTGKLLDSVELESEGIGHRFQKDDVLFGKLRPYLAKVFLAQEEGLSSTEALVFRSSEVIYPKFLSYYCLSQDFINEVNGTTFGSKMPRASWDDISSFRMVYPSLDEQKIIVDFLDKRLAQVDALIAKQETLLEKLAEQRVALISHAVTKGLNPDVEMRLSRVDELGQIPNHWIETRLKFMAKIQNGCDYKHVQAEDGYPVIGSGGQFTYATEFLYQGESVLFGRKGTIDKPLYINDAFWTVDTMYYTEILENTFPKFLYYCALTIDFWKYSTQTALPSMTQTVLSNLYFSIPEYDEQKQIAKYLDQKTEELDNQYAKVVEIREKLKEYRSTLITQVVTGKIDVRNLKLN
ncbi:restriction endonuclease subunit S [Acinetobacter bereziniae]|uniref:restriction endonuclease subunit S n=2 Tax=Acinetobacter bereziniae TaxID=106648 RepID=UPI001580AE01|nr:restriction endonuclease subunit S [Acinetobacter bereziniae]NUF64369.1 restriction endonuclease subunit S [Acinetobacter bereziniae]NUG08337.1 restriction endonuclease subunit S [Acinetobacter bereziniae]NUG62686.1 restriction endonuclease subunit S [Acinetobacter bereziniae]NUG69363.1 restriction endonuclease subunit S [Acinetobacter bereziniae]